MTKRSRPLPTRHVVVDHAPVVAVKLTNAGPLFDVSEDTLRRWWHDEGFPVVEVGRLKMVPIAAARRWLESHVGTVETVEDEPDLGAVS